MSLLGSRKQRLYNQLMGKCFAINYLLYSSDHFDHFVTVKEELQLFDSLFSHLLLFHEEYNCFFDAKKFNLKEFDNWFQDFYLQTLA